MWVKSLAVGDTKLPEWDFNHKLFVIGQPQYLLNYNDYSTDLDRTKCNVTEVRIVK